MAIRSVGGVDPALGNMLSAQVQGRYQLAAQRSASSANRYAAGRQAEVALAGQQSQENIAQGQADAALQRDKQQQAADWRIKNEDGRLQEALKRYETEAKTKSDNAWRAFLTKSGAVSFEETKELHDIAMGAWREYNTTKFVRDLMGQAVAASMKENDPFRAAQINYMNSQLAQKGGAEDRRLRKVGEDVRDVLGEIVQRAGGKDGTNARGILMALNDPKTAAAIKVRVLRAAGMGPGDLVRYQANLANKDLDPKWVGQHAPQLGALAEFTREAESQVKAAYNKYRAADQADRAPGKTQAAELQFLDQQHGARMLDLGEPRSFVRSVQVGVPGISPDAMSLIDGYAHSELSVPRHLARNGTSVDAIRRGLAAGSKLIQQYAPNSPAAKMFLDSMPVISPGDPAPSPIGSTIDVGADGETLGLHMPTAGDVMPEPSPRVAQGDAASALAPPPVPMQRSPQPYNPADVPSAGFPGPGVFQPTQPAEALAAPAMGQQGQPGDEFKLRSGYTLGSEIDRLGPDVMRPFEALAAQHPWTPKIKGKIKSIKAGAGRPLGDRLTNFFLE